LLLHHLQRLPSKSSNAEVRSIKNASHFLDQQATKQNFESQIKDANLVHLATHAVTDEQYPEKSFIQFYPASKNMAENKVYLFELSPGLIQKDALVFLSACESVGSQNIAGEGIRGLSRAFYLAGSKNIISSLWKAEDYATAYIASHFYKYLADGKTYEKALQMAKIDLINDPKMTQFRNPKYWSHLIFMGNGKIEKAWYQKPYFWIFIGFVLAIFFTLNFSRPKASV
jgi:CHAT domain-containing protein